MTDKKKTTTKKEQSSYGKDEGNDESSEQRYLLPPGLETDCFDLVRAWQFRRQQIRRGKFNEEEEEEEKDGGNEKRRIRDAKISSPPSSSSSSSSSKQRGGGKEEESPFQSFRLLYTERNFDRMFHLKTKFTNPNEQLQRLFDASLAIWDLANDRVFRKKEDESPTSSSLIVGALYLLFMFYRRQPRRDVFFVSRGYRERAKVMEEDEELPKARVYVSLERMRELLGVLERLEEEVEHNKKKKKKKKKKNNKSSSSNEKTEEEDEDGDEDDDVEAALETLAIIKEMFADNAFIVGCTRPLTQRERRDLVESTKVVVNNELLEAYKEVRDEMVSLENGGIPGVQTLLEQTETYGKALDAILVNKQRPVSSTYAAGYLDPAKKIGGAVDRFAKRLEGKLEEILKAKPKQKRARKTPTPTETSTKVVTTTAGGLTVVNTKKITVITSAKEAPISSKRKKERRDLESMPDYYEKDEGN
jgi:hypothetical protein|tara:strand:+ start:781 stop:2202 length:1422 start_codon:yes stop_codon:yes gene_type:complete